MIPIKELANRLIAARWWLLAQAVALPCALLAGIGWTRIPEKHAWQVLLSLLIPALIAAGVLALIAATLRKLSSEEKRASLGAAALMLLGCLLLGWFAWSIVAWAADQSWNWAMLLSSKAPASLRARLLSYDHLARGITLLLWVLKWIVIPGKLIPLALDVAVCGWRIRWRRVLRLHLDWRWWLTSIAAALLAVWLPGRWYGIAPHGSPRAQEWAVGLKLGGTSLLVLACLLLLQAWAAVLLARQPEPAADALDARIARRLHTAWRWIAAFAVWTLCATLNTNWQPHGEAQSFDYLLKVILDAVVFIALPLLATGLMRALPSEVQKPVHFVWGTLLLLLFSVVELAALFLGNLYNIPVWLNVATMFIVTGVLVPLALLAARHGYRLQLSRALAVWKCWLWWLVVAWALLAGIAFPELVSASLTEDKSNRPLFYWLLDFLTAFCGVVLLALCAELLAVGERSEIQTVPQCQSEAQSA